MMNNDYCHIPNCEYKYNEWLLPLTAYAGLVLPFFLPSIISNLIKPVGIGISLLFIIRSKKVVFRASHFFLLAYAFVMFIALVRAQNSAGYSSSISYIIYIVYAFCYTAVDHKEESVERLIRCCYIAGVTFATIAAICNPLWGTGTMNRTYLRMLNISMNANKVAYTSAIGISTLPYILLDERGLKRGLIKHLPAIIVMIYALLLTMARGPFLSSIASFAILFYGLIRRYAKRSFLYTVLLVSVCAIGISMAYKYMPEDQITRLMTAESYQDANGRFEMFGEAVATVNNIAFGEGAGIWSALGHSSKIHNLFIDVFVETGLLGVGMLIALLIASLIRVRSIELLSIAAPMVVYALVESGDDYIFWVPLILISLLTYKKTV